MNLGPLEIGLIVLAVMLLFGYKQLPRAARALGQSMHILRTEIGGQEKPQDHATDRI